LLKVNRAKILGNLQSPNQPTVYCDPVRFHCRVGL